jgi:Ser/Thr protein kinase RdoA (MazF antagonist)
MTLIDLDQAAAGPAAADLGGMLAGLRYCRRVGLCSRAAERALAGAFLAGYAAVRPLPPPAELRWHAAAALLAERALRAVNRVRAEGLLHLGEILDDARTLLIGDADD